MYYYSYTKGTNIHPNWLDGQILNLAKGNKEGQNDLVVSEHGLMDGKWVRRPDGVVYGHDEFLKVIQDLIMEDVIKLGWRPGVQMETGEWKSPYCHVPIHALDERLPDKRMPAQAKEPPASPEVTFSTYRSKHKIKLWHFDGTDASAIRFARKYEGRAAIKFADGKLTLQVRNDGSTTRMDEARAGDCIELFGDSLLKVHPASSINDNWEFAE